MNKKFIKNCPNCGIEFWTYFSINKKCCTHECANEYRKKISYSKKVKFCLICLRDFVPCRIDIPGIYCSMECSGKGRRKEFIMRNGYKHIYMPTHPKSTKQGYYPEQRLIMENHINRILDKSEIVHHINHIKTDNRIENLMILNESKHKSYHANNTKRSKKGKFLTVRSTY